MNVSTQRRKLLRAVLRVLGAVLAFIVSAVLLLYFRQHSMLYHPRPYSRLVSELLPPNAVELRYGAAAVPQTAFYVPKTADKSLPTRLWVAFGGNGSLALEWSGFIARDPNPANAYLLIEYPGYGESAGIASIAQNRAAAEGALGALAKHLGVSAAAFETPLHVIGHSFGTAAGLDFAARHQVQRIVLVAPFTTLREEAALVVGDPLSHLLIENYDNRKRLAELAERLPPPRIAIFHGTADDIIPVRMGQDLSTRHPQMIQFFPIKGGDHLSPLFKNAPEILRWMNE